MKQSHSAEKLHAVLLFCHGFGMYRLLNIVCPQKVFLPGLRVLVGLLVISFRALGFAGLSPFLGLLLICLPVGNSNLQFSLLGFKHTPGPSCSKYR